MFKLIFKLIGAAWAVVVLLTFETLVTFDWDAAAVVVGCELLDGGVVDELAGAAVIDDDDAMVVEPFGVFDLASWRDESRDEDRVRLFISF